MSDVEYVFNKHSPQQHRKVEVTTNNSLHDISTQNTLHLLIYGATCRIWCSLADCERLTPGLACRCAVTAWQPQAAAWGTRWRPRHSQGTSDFVRNGLMRAYTKELLLSYLTCSPSDFLLDTGVKPTEISTGNFDSPRLYLW